MLGNKKVEISERKEKKRKEGRKKKKEKKERKERQTKEKKRNQSSCPQGLGKRESSERQRVTVPQ